MRKELVVLLDHENDGTNTSVCPFHQVQYDKRGNPEDTCLVLFHHTENPNSYECDGITNGKNCPLRKHRQIKVKLK